MASVLLKRCTQCREYTLQEACPRCGAAAKPNRPAKFSPEDSYGDYRRRLKRLDQAKAGGLAASIPAADSAGKTDMADRAGKPAKADKAA